MPKQKYCFDLLKCNVWKITSCMTACSGHPTALISVCVLFICNSSSPFIGRSGIPGDGSWRLVSWAVMDTGGQRKCLHGWDQSTVLGLVQRPWRLIISPQKCSFMLLILCKLVSDFSVQAIFPPLSPPTTDHPNGSRNGLSYLASSRSAAMS